MLFGEKKGTHSRRKREKNKAGRAQEGGEKKRDAKQRHLNLEKKLQNCHRVL